MPTCPKCAHRFAAPSDSARAADPRRRKYLTDYARGRAHGLTGKPREPKASAAYRKGHAAGVLAALVAGVEAVNASAGQAGERPE